MATLTEPEIQTPASVDALQYVRNLHNGRAEMYIHTHIGQDPERGPGILSQDFTREMTLLIDEFHVQHIDVHINSVGGSVIEGMGIFTALMNSKAAIHTYCDGIAASIAGIIFQAGRKRLINDFARVMIHDVKAPAGTPSAAIDNFRDMVLQVLVNNTGKTTEEIERYMNGETWFTATEAISAGLADQIVNTNRLLQLARNEQTNINAIYNACNDIINSNNKPKPLKMLKLSNALDLQEGANEETVLKAVEEIQNTVETLTEEKATATTELEAAKAENEKLQAEIDALKKDAAELNDAAATEFVQNLVEAGKIDANKAESVTGQAKADLEGVKALFEAVTVQHADITNVIQPSETPKAEAGLREMEKKQPEKLEAIRNEQPELYAEMYKKQYGVEFEIN